MNSEQVPCPFCEQIDYSITISPTDCLQYAALCHNCGCYGPVSDTVVGASKAWRERKSKKITQKECINCYHYEKEACYCHVMTIQTHDKGSCANFTNYNGEGLEVI